MHDLADTDDLRAHVRLERALFGDLEAPQAVEHDAVVVLAGADDLDDPGEGSDLVDVFEGRLVLIGAALAHDPDQRPLAPE